MYAMVFSWNHWRGEARFNITEADADTINCILHARYGQYAHDTLVRDVSVLTEEEPKMEAPPAPPTGMIAAQCEMYVKTYVMAVLAYDYGARVARLHTLSTARKDVIWAAFKWVAWDKRACPAFTITDEHERYIHELVHTGYISKYTNDALLHTTVSYLDEPKKPTTPQPPQEAKKMANTKLFETRAFVRGVALDTQSYEQLVAMLENNNADAERIKPLAKNSPAIKKRLDQLNAANTAIMAALENLPD